MKSTLKVVKNAVCRLSSAGQINYLFGFYFLLFFSACKKEEKNEMVYQTGTVTDIEGRTYKTVKIGETWWMAENLAVASYSDGSPIEFIQNDQTLWAGGKPAVCRYDNNDKAPGLLYNWASVNHPAGLAPKGWHIASEAEWQELEKYLGMVNNEIELVNWRLTGNCGDKLKIEGPTGWLQIQNVWGNNSSGFTALAGGCRLWNGNWSNPGLNYTGFWWTSSERDLQNAFFRNLDYKHSGVFRFYVDKRYGMSVRCVKNK
jgi:uncharacterized protein (TIGR02145 family)